MVKANAYGHGVEWVADQLIDQPKLHGFGVATLEEGVLLRKHIERTKPRRLADTRIIVFSGATPWTEDKGRLCERFHLTPVLTSDADWAAFLRHNGPQRLPYELKFNTGMNRLGLSLDRLDAVLRQLRARPRDEWPEGVLSHLALGESPTHATSRRQLENFRTLHHAFKAAHPRTRLHLGNSAGIWNASAWKLKDLTDCVRPGLALYGVRPLEDTPAPGLTPVLTLKARVVLIRTLQPGETLGYGARFKVGRNDAPKRIAILGAGYADGLHRVASFDGHIWLRGKACRFLGVISMDLAAVECPPGAQVNDWAEILGPNLDHWKLAHAAHTIPYELLTSVSISNLTRDRFRAEDLE